jgi:hypothetical protein
MALTAEEVKLLNNATPGLHKAGLGDIIQDIVNIIQDMLTSQLHAGGNATTEDPGLMSAADKTKLDGIAASANDYTLPNAGTLTRGGVLKGVAVVDAKDNASAITQVNALLASLRTSGAIAT